MTKVEKNKIARKVMIVSLFIISVSVLMGFLLRPPFPLLRITHPPLSGQIDLSPFFNAGCKMEEHNGGTFLNCSAAGLEERFNCSRISPAPQYLVGLKVPIVECVVGRWSEEVKKGYVSMRGCLVPIYIRYIVFDGEDFKLLRTEEEFKDYFSPIDAPEEALSYVAAITGNYPEYGFSKSGGRYLVAVIEDSYSKEVNGNFKVHLYGFVSCGCGMHPYYTIDFLVSRDGNIKELRRQNIWVDPSFVACID